VLFRGTERATLPVRPLYTYIPTYTSTRRLLTFATLFPGDTTITRTTATPPRAMTSHANHAAAIRIDCSKTDPTTPSATKATRSDQHDCMRQCGENPLQRTLCLHSTSSPYPMGQRNRVASPPPPRQHPNTRLLPAGLEAGRLLSHPAPRFCATRVIIASPLAGTATQHSAFFFWAHRTATSSPDLVTHGSFFTSPTTVVASDRQALGQEQWQKLQVVFDRERMSGRCCKTVQPRYFFSFRLLRTALSVIPSHLNALDPSRRASAIG